MSKTCLFLQCRTKTSIHGDSTVYTAVPHSSKLSINDSSGFTGYRVLLKAFEYNFWFTLAAPHFLPSIPKGFRICFPIASFDCTLEHLHPRVFLRMGFNIRQRETITDYFYLLFIIQALTISIPFGKEKPITFYHQS